MPNKSLFKACSGKKREIPPKIDPDKEKHGFTMIK